MHCIPATLPSGVFFIMSVAFNYDFKPLNLGLSSKPFYVNLEMPYISFAGVYRAELSGHCRVRCVAKRTGNSNTEKQSTSPMLMLLLTYVKRYKIITANAVASTWLRCSHVNCLPSADRYVNYARHKRVARFANGDVMHILRPPLVLVACNLHGLFSPNWQRRRPTVECQLSRRTTTSRMPNVTSSVTSKYKRLYTKRNGINRTWIKGPPATAHVSRISDVAEEFAASLKATVQRV